MAKLKQIEEELCCIPTLPSKKINTPLIFFWNLTCFVNQFKFDPGRLLFFRIRQNCITLVVGGARNSITNVFTLIAMSAIHNGGHTFKIAQ